MTLVTALAAPVEDGMMFPEAARPPRGRRRGGLATALGQQTPIPKFHAPSPMKVGLNAYSFAKERVVSKDLAGVSKVSQQACSRER